MSTETVKVQHTFETLRVEPSEFGGPELYDGLTEVATFHYDCTLPGKKRITKEQAEANARRIVAAVNACKGISTEALECDEVGKALRCLKRMLRHFREGVPIEHSTVLFAAEILAKMEGV